MTNEEAIKILDIIPISTLREQAEALNLAIEALNLAIEALKAQQWTPCSERPPEYGEPVLTWDGRTYSVEKRCGKVESLTLCDGNGHKQEFVAVVRCKDCKHRKRHTTFAGSEYYMCDHDSDPHSASRPAEEDDWFCADGEKEDI